MDQRKYNERYLKRKKQLKRRRMLWTILFVGLGALLAFKAVSFAKDKLSEDHTLTTEVPTETTVVVGGTESAAETNATNQTDQTNNTDQTQQTEPSEKLDGQFVVKQKDAWQYILVNKSNPIDKTFAPPETFLVNGTYKADLRIKEATRAMFDAAKVDGVTLTACSAYRAYDYQQKLFDRMKAKYSNLSDEAAATEAAK